MKLDPSEKIADIPMLQIRKLLKRGTRTFWGTDFVEYVLGISHEEAQNLIQELEKEGIIERDADFEEPRWQNTTKGNAIAYASAAKPIKRSTADRALDGLLDRVEQVNNDPYYLYKVTKVLVFGSYLTDVERLNDVDVAIALEPKEADQEVRNSLFEAWREAALAMGRTYKDHGEWVLWPYLETFKYLKSRSRTLSLHDTSDGILEEVEYKIIYPTKNDPAA